MIQWKRGHKNRNSQLTLLLVFYLIAEGQGHGRLMEPPNRSSLWRLKEFEAEKPEKNYDDNQLWCGGMGSQYNLSGGKCGPCGDEYLKSRPRENENGGRYGRGIITRIYKPGETIPIGVELTVNHLGYFIFTLCPIQTTLNGEITMEEEECFEKYPLPLADGTGTKFLVKSNDTGYYKTYVQLPKDLSCKQCVLRWHYRTGNRWNYVNNETGALGIGDQEIFRGCSDITIGSFPAPVTTTTSTPGTVKPTSRPVPIPTIVPPRPAITPPSTSSRPTTSAATASSIVTTTVNPTTTTSQISITTPPVTTGRPRPFPTQRPPAVILPAAPTQHPPSENQTIMASENSSASVSNTTTNEHPHPVMRPPPQSKIKLRESHPIILATLLDSLANSL